MVVMEGLTYHMIGHAINYIIRSYFTPELYELYQCAMPFTAESKNLFLINTTFAIFGDKYLSQDLIVILRNITQLCQVDREGGGGEGGLPSRDRLLSFIKLESLTQC